MSFDVVSRFCVSLVLTGGFCLGAIFHAGCRAPQGEYPVGIYSPGGSTNYVMLRQVGFSHIASGASMENLDAAQAAGLKVLATPGMSACANLDTNRVYKVVKAADRHPALYAWYLIDEPDYSKTDPAYVQALNDYLKARGVRKPTALVMFKGYEAADYAKIPDIMMLDRYPIGWQPIETFGKHLRLARYASGNKPLIAVIQAFDWRYYPTVWGGDETVSRPPTLEELRSMTWSSLALGATGVFYYCYDNAKAWKMSEHPTEWEALKRVVEEVRAFEPLFEAEHAWWPRRVEYLNPEQGFNAVHEPSILAEKLLVKNGSSSLPAGEYLLCVNSIGEEVPFRIALPGIHTGRVFSRSPDFPGTDFSESVEGWVSEKLAPFEVRIYGPLVLY